MCRMGGSVLSRGCGRLMVRLGMAGLSLCTAEAGYQPQILRGGMHFFFPFMYRIHLEPLVTVSLGTIAYVFARDGEPLSPAQTLGRVVPIDDVAEFLANGGQRGPQRLILREGT